MSDVKRQLKDWARLSTMVKSGIRRWLGIPPASSAPEDRTAAVVISGLMQQRALLIQKIELGPEESERDDSIWRVRSIERRIVELGGKLEPWWFSQPLRRPNGGSSS